MQVSDEKVLTAGGNDEGQLGVDSQKGALSDVYELQLALETHNGKVSSIACGWSHTLVLVENTDGTQSLFTFGSNSFGQLGLSTAQASIALPIPLPSGPKVSFVSCGLRHSAFTTDDGALWLFGENRFGQCGVATLAPVTVPTRLSTSLHVSSISLGSRHTVLLTSTGELYAFGENRFGQCGVDLATVDPITRPNTTKVAKDLIVVPRRVDISASMDKTTILRTGWNFSLVFINSTPQRLLLFGRNNYGQLGLGHPSPFVWTPTELDTSFLNGSTISQVECGSEHTIVLSSAGRVFTFGWNDHGQLGQGDETDRSQASLVPGLQERPVSRIAAGYGFSFAVVDNL